MTNTQVHICVLSVRLGCTFKPPKLPFLHVKVGKAHLYPRAARGYPVGCLGLRTSLHTADGAVMRTVSITVSLEGY